MFTVGLDVDSRAFFGSVTILIGIPTAIKIFNWVYSMILSKIFIGVEYLYVVVFLKMFIFGGITGLILANVSIDIQLHDTYFVIAHFHYVLSLGAVVGILSGIINVMHKIIFLEYSKVSLLWNFLIFFIGSNLGPARVFVFCWPSDSGEPRKAGEFF